MEVHSHTHTPRKKWTHYFWEFLMLFLAVTLGFFVENIREHSVEQERAKLYARSLYHELVKDTVELNDVITEQQGVLSSCDSLGKLISDGIKGNIVFGRFYYLCNAVSISPIVIWNKATLTQLTQSGTLRYFENPELVNKISYYYSQSDYFTALVDNDRSKRDKSLELRNKILVYSNFKLFTTFGIKKQQSIPDTLLTSKMYLQDSNPQILNEYANSFESRKRSLLLLKESAYPTMIISARELIQLLKKEYQLE